MGNIKLKQKIIKINSYSILLIISIFALLNFVVVYYVLNDAYKKEVEIIKEQYLLSQKEIIKNQVNNFINFIEHTKKLETKNKLSLLKQNVKALSNVLSISNPKNFVYMLSNSKKKTPFFDIGLSDVNGNMIFFTNKGIKHSKLRHKAIKKGFAKIIKLQTKKGVKYSYILKFKNKIDGKYYIIGNSIFKSTIDDIVKKIVLDRLNTLRFGTKNNGYISVGEILNYNGGKGFAKVIALPIKPEWVGKLLDDDKKDAKGKEYRKEYLKIINTTKEGFVSYWFFKKDDKTVHPKISYIKLYEPYNWIVFAGVYLDDIQQVIENKKKITKAEMKKIFYIYVVFLVIFLIISYLISKYENNILQDLIDSYEKEINEKNKELIKINKNLEQEVKKKTQELLESLLKDPLTKLPNREKLLLDISENDYIAVINIDSFKEINDFYGLKIGDLVLKKFANILNSVSYNRYRLSADEFALRENNLDILKLNVKNLIELLSKTSIKVDDDLILNISISAGIGKTLVEADIALKYAKKDKYEKLVVYNEDIKLIKEYENNLKWKNIIRKAIKEDNILVYVQPIVNNITQKVDKYECLIRLKNEDKIYTPYFFLDIAKKTKQYYELQKIMVQKSFEKFSKLDSKFSINLSIFDLSNYSFKEFLLEKIEEYNVQDKLIIEILEDEELLDEEVLKFLNMLKRHNIKISIDDFGSGYSNFSYLIKALPVSILKIDGSLVKCIATSNKDYRLFKSIVNMAKEFDFEIVAEFVENEEIFKILKELKVDYSQGYYFSKPFDINQL